MTELQAATDPEQQEAVLTPAPMPSDIDPALVAWLQDLFGYDELHIRQKLVAIAEKYMVLDAYDQPRFYVVRPPRLLLNLVLRVFVSVVNLMVLIVAFRFFLNGNVGTGVGILVVAQFFLGIALVLMSPYRDIEVFDGLTQSWRLLLITQDNKLGLWRRYTLYDLFGTEVARFERNTLMSIIRKDWRVVTPAGEPIFRIREDSWVRSILRRRLGPMYGLLRTNFHFEYPGGPMFGRYDRKLTIRDQYRLDLRGDPHRLVDRRLTLAMAILLDTGESR